MKHRSIALLGLAALALLVSAPKLRADWSPFGSYWENIARATAANDGVLVQKLLAEGRNPNETDENDRTGMHVAAVNGNLHIAAILIKASAKLSPVDKLGNTPLHYAAERDQVEMAKLLLDLGVPVDPENKNGMTPLMISASKGYIDLVQALLAKGASATKTDFTGRDAVSWAGESRKPGVIQTLKRAANAKHS